MRLLVLAVAALTFLFLGLQSLQFQVETTSARANLTVTNAQNALNTTNATAEIMTRTIGHSMPLFLGLAAIVFAVVLLWMVGR